VSVTNRGLNSSSNGNSQQNVLTPNWPDIVTCEVPSEAIYLYDSHERAWYSPTFHPLGDTKANYQVEFGVDGTATYHMSQASLATELTVFVPPDESLGVYLLTVRNLENVIRRIRVAPYFQMVLSTQPEHTGPLNTHVDQSLSAIFFENPRNEYRSGPAFVAMTPAVEEVETCRGRFFGAGRDVARPYLVERGRADASANSDDRPVAGMLATLDIPALGECTIAIVLGQADDRPQAEALVRKYRQVAVARASLAETKKWWCECLATVRLKSSDPSLDHNLHWLKYQTLAERLWARRGYYQASGAFGFRDQLQDAVNLLWMEPQLARRQILLHASQQFIEGDVLQWFHRLQDGRTGFAARNYASDPLLWLPWAAAEYAAATGDESLFDEQTTYVEGPAPLAPLPAGKHGMAFVPHRSPRSDTVYRHCVRAIDLVLERRMGVHGLPLICAGDWNDGLDEIGSEGKGESVWLGFFLYYILGRMSSIIEKREGRARRTHYDAKGAKLKDSLERAWRGDRYLRAFHDDGTEIGVKQSGVWEIDALTAAWAVIAGMDHARARTAFDTALSVLEKDTVILLGWPPLRDDTKPFLGRSSFYPEGVRENGMYCHGVQWLVGAARVLCERLQDEGNFEEARKYRDATYRLWQKISPLGHTTAEEIEIYGGQPNKQAADILTVFDPGRMIWNGYTGAAGWMFRQALEGVAGARLVGGEVILPDDFGEPRGDLTLRGIRRELRGSPLSDDAGAALPERVSRSHDDAQRQTQSASQPHILQGATQKKG
jgi:cyclic beta-1,2-glucan synthetase